MKVILFLVNLVVYLVIPFAFALLFAGLFWINYWDIVRSNWYAVFYFLYAMLLIISALVFVAEGDDDEVDRLTIIKMKGHG